MWNTCSQRIEYAKSNYLAREEALAGQPEWETLLKEAVLGAVKFPKTDLPTIAEIISTEIQNAQIKKSNIKP
jgi:hypothetical protein